MSVSPARRLAVILHADVIDSTSLVQRDEGLAHQRIQDAFRRFSQTISNYSGTTLELRGDALLAEFGRASDAVCAALSFQMANAEFNDAQGGDIRAILRVGLSLGEVVIADDTVTGAGVVLAQRLEQLAASGGVVTQGAVSEAVPTRLPFTYKSLGEQQLKGFDQPVRAFAVTLKPGESVPAPEAGAASRSGSGGPGAGEELELPDKPSIAVLPFENMSGDPEQGYFSDGITEDIITELSRFPTLFVIARHSSFSLKGQTADLREVAQKLGVKYVAKGSVRKAGQRIRISVQLAEALTGRQIWADRYDRSLDDIFSVQDEVAATIVSSLSGRVARAEQKATERKRTTSLSAYEHFLRGNAHFYRLNREDNFEARRMFQSAIALDPNFARAYARLGATYNVEAFMGHGPDSSWDTAMEAVQKGLAIDPEDSWIHETLGFVLLRSGQFEEAEGEFRRALELNPNDADSIAWTAHAFVLLGFPEEAGELIRKAMRLNPLHPGSYNRTLGEASYFCRDYEHAARALRQGSTPGGWRYLFLGATYARLGRLEEARAEISSFTAQRRTELQDHGHAPQNDDMGTCDASSQEIQAHNGPRTPSRWFAQDPAF